MPPPIPATSDGARALTRVIKNGDVETLGEMLGADPGVALIQINDGTCVRSTLHLATDWPGKRANAGKVIAMLVDAGCDPDVRAIGPHSETPLHWAASADDIEAIDALVASGADLEVEGAVIGGLTPLADAVGFGQRQAAQRLVEHGAAINFWQAAALGRTDLIETGIADETAESITNAFWVACSWGCSETAALLSANGADRDWVGHDGLTPRAAAEREGHDDIVTWLDS